MDGLTHSLVGLLSAKAGLERLSPYTTTACILSANAPDIDAVTVLGGRWTLLQYHRGITHSIVGTLLLGLLIPSVLYGLERGIARWRKRPPRVRYRGLLLASLIAAATHPVMDWTNNYGVRPFLPWNGKWFYGDLVFIVDPYLLLILGGAAFLITSNRWWRVVGWSLLAVAITIIVIGVSPPRSGDGGGLAVARTIWIAGVLALGLVRLLRVPRNLSKSLALGALTAVVLYWGALAWAHHAAYRNALIEADTIASQQGEHLIRVAAMPTAANPFRWLSVAETDRAMYRFFVGIGEPSSSDVAKRIGNDSRAGAITSIERYEKPTGQSEKLVSKAARDPRAQVLLGFARFPVARIGSDNCIVQALVQFADLRYTEPGVSRGNFALTVPVDCPAP